MLDMAYLYTKFYDLAWAGPEIGLWIATSKIYNGSRDPDHAPIRCVLTWHSQLMYKIIRVYSSGRSRDILVPKTVKLGHVTWPCPLQKWFVIHVEHIR